MNPELIKNCYLMTDEKHKWIKAHQHDRDEEDDLDVLSLA